MLEPIVDINKTEPKAQSHVFLRSSVSLVFLQNVEHCVHEGRECLLNILHLL